MYWISPGDPLYDLARRLAEEWRRIAEPWRVGPAEQVGWMDWGVFWGEVWESRYDILLTVVPGGAVLRVLRVALRGRCFVVLVCFVEGTGVLTAEGAKDIETIQPGEMIWSYNAAEQGWELNEVVATSASDYEGDLVRLEIEHEDGRRESIGCTGTHPFWVQRGVALDERPTAKEIDANEPLPTPSGRWTEARWLRLGDVFLTRTGKSATVVGLTIRLERVKVYNLTVNRLHNFAVGECGVLVHNAACGQLHHAISTRIGRAITEHPLLRGHFSIKDPRFVTRGRDAAAHRGYQHWHRELDREMARHIQRSRRMTPEQFERYLSRRYAQPDLARRFPNTPF